MSKIVLVGINFHPEFTSTGKYTTELALGMVERGHSVRVICPPPYYPEWKVRDGYSAFRYRRDSFQGIDIRRCPLWVPSQPSSWRRLFHLASFALSTSLPLLLAARWRPDWILLVVPTILCAPLVLLSARLARAKSWIHVQDLEAEAAMGLRMFEGMSVTSRAVLSLEHRLLHGFDRISTISNGMLAHLQGIHIPTDRLQLIPNWVDVEAIRPLPPGAATGLRQQLGLPPGKIVVLYAGNFGRKQGLRMVIDVAEALRGRNDLVFVFVGDGAERGQIEASAKTLSNVIFRSSVAASELNELLNLADIHLVPQRAGVDQALLPSKLGGILSSGRPLVATATSGSELAKLAVKGGVVVEPGSAAALAGAILALAHDPERRRRLGEAGRRYAVENLAKDIILEQALEGI